MNVIKFKAEGILNSFRVPLFKTYHRTFLAPTKTNIIGMITNIMGKSEKWYYEALNENRIQVSVIINNIGGKTKDLWSYKTYKDKNNGRSIIRRDKLFKAIYTIYLLIDSKELFKEILIALKLPTSIPSLGLDDELIKISEVEDRVQISENNSRRINSVFVDKGYSYKAIIENPHQFVEFPIVNEIPLSFKVKRSKEGSRESRQAIDIFKQVEYLNCLIELENVASYSDGVNRMVFY
ncbi:MAG: CRISPR-associated protein Cas5 [Candidatus Lokiarchaeota archaeon]|nr:CRISPR-associated protein Cas5 [Candidatus Lokiarchaeota archaeon]